jgi:RNA polymerase sigma-70 factor (ECF subfamily)
VTEAPTAAQLLADLAWLRRLAFALARDADDADDLVQESWIAAWKRRPATDRALRPWLGKVVRDLAAMKRRGDVRRRARELTVPDDDQAASPEALLETMRLHRTLVDCVLELDEPFRATIIASFVEGRSSAEISRSLGIPDSTVRWRLREGLARLRAQLDTKVGHRWAPVLLVLRRGAVVTTSSKLAAVVVATIVLLLLAGTGVYVALTTSPDHHGDTATRAGVTGTNRAVDDARPEAAVSSRPWWDASGRVLRPIAGHVVTTDGSPIAGATVALYGWSAVVASTPEATLVTDGSGAFRLAKPHDATVYRVVATAPGRAGRTVNADPRGAIHSDSERIVIALPACSSTVEGIVTDSGAGPIGGAVVTASTRNFAVGATVTTSRDGHYELCVAPEIEVLEVGAEGYEHVTVPIAPHDRQHVDIALAPGADLVGRVVDADSGAGVANAQVFASGRMLYGYAAAPRQSLSDADGAFALTGLKAGELLLNVWSGDHVLIEPMRITSVAGHHLGPVVVTMRAAATLRGIVRRDGRPLPGANVSFDMPSARGAVPSLHVVTGTDGRFVALGVIPAAGVVARVDGMTVLAPATIDTRHPSDIVIDVAPRPTIRGHVVHHGKPVIDAAVSLTGAPERTTTTSDATGAFELAAPAPGSYGVYADSKLDRAFTSHSVAVVAPSDRDVIVELDGGASITGIVVDADGKPQPGLIVRGVRTTGDDLGGAVTAVDGAFTLDELAGRGDYAITVMGSVDGPSLPWAGAAPGPISVATGDSNVSGVRLVITNRHGSTIRGAVVDDAGSPVADAFVRLRGAAEAVRSDAAGRFALPVFGDGPFWLVAATDWRRPAGSATGIAPGATDVTITIARSGSVRGTLVGFVQPSVTMRMIGDAYPQIARVDGSSFALDDLVAGDYVIGVTSTDGHSASTTAHVASGATTTLTLTAPAVHHVDARVSSFETGAAVAGVRCVVVAIAGDVVPAGFGDHNANTSVSDSTGRVAFDAAPTGDAAVVCQSTPQTTSGVARVAGDVTSVRVVHIRGEDRPGSIGVIFDMSRLTAVIQGVIPQSAAAVAGVHVGDVVVAVDGVSIVGLGPDAVNTWIGGRGAGASVSLTLLRGNTNLDVTLAVGPPG